MDRRAKLKTDIGSYIAVYCGPYERPHFGSMSFWLARNIDRSSSRDLHVAKLLLV